jgi:hypothetical protein
MHLKPQYSNTPMLQHSNIPTECLLFYAGCIDLDTVSKLSTPFHLWLSSGI